jgi:hypothetical protein
MPTMAEESPGSSSSAPVHSGREAGVQRLLQRLPSQYALSTSYTDRVQHARLLSAMEADPSASTNVHLAWATENGNRATIWLVFSDRRGSLGLITAVLSELGVNIGKASVFSTSDGAAVDSFSVDRYAHGPLLSRDPLTQRSRARARVRPTAAAGCVAAAAVADLCQAHHKRPCAAGWHAPVYARPRPAPRLPCPRFTRRRLRCSTAPLGFAVGPASLPPFSPSGSSACARVRVRAVRGVAGWTTASPRCCARG